VLENVTESRSPADVVDQGRKRINFK